MKHNTEFIQSFMAHYDYPSEAVEIITDILNKLDEKKTFGKRFDAMLNAFADHRLRIDSKLLERLGALAVLMGCSPYTMYFVFLLSLTENLKNQYDFLGIDEKTYWDTMLDLKCKMLECMECKGVPGSMNAPWLNGYFRLERIAYGRFAYEVCRYDRDEPFTMKNGHTVKKGDIYIGFHIPSSGVSLTDEVRSDSYKKAYEHVKTLFPDGKVIFGCGSWLLFPKQREFLPKNSNILKFMDNFEIVESNESNSFDDAWRIYGRYAALPCEKLPRDTGLRKAYAEWLCAGNKAGGAFGLFMFDGKKII